MPETVTILVVDDMAAVRGLTVATVEQLPGLRPRVLEASNGREAVDIAVRMRPDTILMDWEMPLMSGVDATRELRLRPETRDIPVLICTAKRHSVENLHTALEAGATDFIRKPAEHMELMARVRSSLQLSRTLRDLTDRNEELERLNRDLLSARDEIRNLSEFLSMCAHCRRVEGDDGAWASLEEHVHTHTDSKISHGLCPTCLAKYYPELIDV